MARQFDDPQLHLEATDELPVLSGADIHQFERNRRSAVSHQTVDRLDQSVESLRQALENADLRWRELEARLEDQDRAIERLNDSLGRTGAAPAPPDVTSAEAALPELTEIVTTEIVRGHDSVAAAPEPEVGDSPAEIAFLERIAGLESYIAGRADRWRAMEADLAIKARRISELEAELDQRIAREDKLAQRIHDEVDRSDGLRSQLRRLNLRLSTLLDKNR